MVHLRIFASLLVLWSVVGLLGCGGGGGGGGAAPPRDTVAPVVTLLSPLSGDCLCETQNVVWFTEDEAVGTVKIELTGPGGTTVLADGLADSGTYSWDTTALADGNTYVLRVTATDSAGNTGVATSTNGNIIVDNTDPTVTVTAPTGGEYWNTTKSITWTTTDDNRGTVLVELSNDGGSTYSTELTTDTTDVGSFTLDTTAIADGANYRVRVTPTDEAGNAGAADESTADFIIDNTVPNLTLTSPAGGEVWGGVHNITWNCADTNRSVVLVELSADGGTTWSTLAAAATDNGSYSFNTGSRNGANYRVRLTPSDLAGNSGTPRLSAVFTIDNTDPTVALTSPIGGEIWNGLKSVTWNTTDANEATVLIEISANGGTSYSTLATVPDTGSYDYNFGSQSNGANYRVRVTATDDAGNVGAASASPANFTVDKIAPVIALTSPSGGELWRGNKPITWNTTDANPGTVLLQVSTDGGANFTALQVSVPDTGSYTLDTTALSDSGNCRVRLTATDGAGNVGGPSVLGTSFTIDNRAPGINLNSPAAGNIWGGTENITWTTNDANPGTVLVELSADGGTSYSTLHAATPDTGAFAFNTTGRNGANFRVRVTATDGAGNVGSASALGADFVIDNILPDTTLTSPVGGELLSGTNTITWSTTEINKATVLLEISADGGSNYSTIATVTDTGSYDYNFNSQDNGANYRIRVTPTDGAGNVGLASASPGSFVIDKAQPVIALTSPTGGQYWNGTEQITWMTTDANPSTVLIEVSDDGGATFSTLAAAAPDTGVYAFDTTGRNGANFRIRVTATDGAGNVSEAKVSAADFTIDNALPVISLISPDGGEYWRDTKTVAWSTTELNKGTVLVELSADGGTSYSTLVAAAPDTGTFSFDTTGRNGANFKVRVTPTDLAGNVGTAQASTASFTIDNIVPVIALTSPLGGQHWKGTQQITWSTTDANPGTVLIEVSDDSGVSFTTLQAVVPDTGSYAFDTTGRNGANFRIRLTATDDAGNVSEVQASTSDFVIDNIVPVISLTSPVGGEFWSGTESIIWSTTEANPGTVLVEVSDDGGATFSTLAAAAPDTGSFAFNTTGQSDGANFKVRLTPTDAAGNDGTAKASTAYFTIDNTVPNLTITSPAGGEVWAGTHNITWNCTEANRNEVKIEISSDDGTNWSLLQDNAPDNGNYALDTTVQSDGANFKVRLTPTDAAGNDGTARISNTFTIDNSGPDLAITSPGGGEWWAGTQNITWTCTEANKDEVHIELSADGGATWSTLEASATDNGTYAFDTGSRNGSNFRVRLTATDLANNSGTPRVSALFTIDNTAPDLTLTSPAGGEVWGGTHNITWSCTEANPGGVRIDISSDGGTNWSLLELNAPDNGSYPFDTTGRNGANFKLRLTPTDAANNEGTARVSNTFAIDNTNPTITLTAPNGGGILSGMQTITWTSSDTNKDKVLIEVSRDNGSSYETVDANAADTGSYDINTASVVDATQCFIRVTAIDAAGNSSTPDVSDASFGIDNVAPTLTITSPSGGENWNGTNNVTWSTNDVHPYQVDIGIGTAPMGPFTPLTSNETDDGSYSFNTADLDNGTYYLQIVATDGAGHTGPAEVSASFTLANVKVAGKAVYYDTNRNGQADMMDIISIPFNVDVRVNSSSISSFALPVTGDTFGSGGADVRAGSPANMVEITLGMNPTLRTRQTFSSSKITANSPSGISLSGTMAANAIESNSDGTDAVPSEPVDIVPGLVWTSQNPVSNCNEAALIDANKDGKMDVIVATGMGGHLFINNGNGWFTQSTVGNNAYTSCAVGDFNNDGNDDIAYGRLHAGNMVFLGDGLGNFTFTGQYMLNLPTVAIDVADFNRDGNLDILTGNSYQTNVVWINDGTANFSQGTSMGYNSTAEVKAGDLDNDGDLDAIDLYPDKFVVYKNDGAGSFAGSGGSPLIGPTLYELELGDVDSDGDLDIVIAGSMGALVYLNDGTGVFTDTGQSLGIGVYDAALCDYDCDGDLDLALGTDGMSSELWLNNGGGVFEKIEMLLPTARKEVLWYDFDNDGDKDLILLDDNGFNYYSNSLTGTWGTLSYTAGGQALGANFWRCVKTGDIDNDGDIDIVASAPIAGQRVFANDGTGNFTEIDFFGGGNCLHVSLGDVDRDGDLDYLSAENSLDATKIHENNGDGSTTNSGGPVTGYTCNGCTMADFNKDGVIDFAVSEEARLYTQVFLGNTTLTPAWQAWWTGADPCLVLAADLNRDSYPDCITLNRGAGKTADIVYNDGTGLFPSISQNLASGTGLDSGCVGDVDNDGDLDLIIATFNGGPSLLYRYEHMVNTFTTPANPGDLPNDSLWTESCALADLDQDGDLDLLLGNYNAANCIYLNTGIGVFTDTFGSTLGSAVSTYWIAVDDLDGDGDLDIIFADSSSNLSIYFCN